MNEFPLWKRCRVLANPVRLKMLICLVEQPRLYVKALGEIMGLTEDVASKNLQLLASAGCLEYERVGKHLYYSLSRSDELLLSVLPELRGRAANIKKTMSMLTALTHERRILIVAVLKRGVMDIDGLCRQVKVSRLACDRHLNKLVRRGWVGVDGEQCELLPAESGLQQVLIKLAEKHFTLAQV